MKTTTIFHWRYMDNQDRKNGEVITRKATPEELEKFKNVEPYKPINYTLCGKKKVNHREDKQC